MPTNPTPSPSPQGSTQLYPAGSAPDQFKPGTLLGCHGHGFVSTGIRVFQRLRFRGPNRKFAWVNHIACVLDTAGNLLEMGGDGADLTNASHYQARDYVIIDPDLHPADLPAVLGVWDEIHALHTRYGFIEIASIVSRLVTGSHFQFSNSGQLICSGAAAVGLCASDLPIPLAWRVTPSFVLPAEIAQFYNACPREDPCRSETKSPSSSAPPSSCSESS